MIETLLDGCMTWSPNKPDYDRLRRVHHSMLLRCLGWRKRKRVDHTLVVWCCCSHINSHNQVRGHRTGSSHSGAEEYPRRKTQTNQRWYTHISQLTQFMPPPETINRESAYDVPGLSILVHTSHYSRLGKPTIPFATQERLARMYCSYMIVPITTRTHDRRKSIGKKKQRNKKEIKERKEKTR